MGVLRTKSQDSFEKEQSWGLTLVKIYYKDRATIRGFPGGEVVNTEDTEMQVRPPGQEDPLE